MWVHVFLIPVNLKHWLFGAQVNAAVIASRFAFRAMADQRNLMFVPGCIRVWLPPDDARELRAVVLAEQQLFSRARGAVDGQTHRRPVGPAAAAQQLRASAPQGGAPGTSTSAQGASTCAS